MPKSERSNLDDVRARFGAMGLLLAPAAWADRIALLELEQAATGHPDFAFLGQLGAAVHVLARR